MLSFNIGSSESNGYKKISFKKQSNQFGMTLTKIKFESIETELKNNLVYSLQILVSSTLSLFIFVLPTLIGVSKNFESNNDEYISLVDVSRLVTLCLIGTPTGCILNLALAKRFSVQKAVFLIPRILIWFLFAFTNLSTLLFLSFALLAFSDSLISIPMFFHARRIRDPLERKILTISSIFSAIIGYIIIFNLGMHLSWRHLALIGLMIHICLYFASNYISEEQTWQSLNRYLVQVLPVLESYDYQTKFEELKTAIQGHVFMVLNLMKNILMQFFDTDEICVPLLHASFVHGDQSSEHLAKAIYRLAAGIKLESIEENETEIEEDVGIVIGIDLGTTDSSVSVSKNGRIEMVANEQGKTITPSYVSFTAEGVRLVGDKAKDQLLTNPENTIFNVKRFIGLEFNNPAVQSEIKSLPFKVIERNGRPCIQVETNRGVDNFEPEQISAMILDKMKEAAEVHLGEKVTHAIVTVPANFNNTQRQAIIDAGTIARLKVLRIINEPTAAAIGSDINKTSGKKTVLVYKLGGGSFDVTLLTIDGREIKVLATDGIPHLGGDDFTRRVMDHLIALHRQMKGIDISNDKCVLQKLRLDVESGKRILCVAQTCNIDIKSTKHELTRSKFEELNMDLFQSTVNMMQKLLNDAQMNKKNIDHIILDGESTRIPKIQQMVQEFFDGKEVMCNSSKETVSMGTAKQAGILSGQGDPKAVQKLSEVNSLSLGVELLGKWMSVIIPRNTTIPMEKSNDNYTTVFDNQESVKIRVFEGEHEMVEDNHFLGEFKLTGIKPARAGVPKFIETMEIDMNGILTVTAKEKGTTNQNYTVIDYYRNRLSKEDIERMKIDM